MAKRKSTENSEAQPTPPQKGAKRSKGLFESNASNFDPTLASLFSASSGPVQTAVRQSAFLREPATEEEDDEELSELDEDIASEPDSEALAEADAGGEAVQNTVDVKGATRAVSPIPLTAFVPIQERKRKRKQEEDNLEATYFQKLAREDDDGRKSRTNKNVKRLREDEDEDEDASTGGADAVNEAAPATDGSAPGFPIQHETSANAAESKTETELDKASRTVFLANVSIEAITSKSAKATLLAHLSSHFAKFPPSTPPHKIESFRFRSTAYATPLPKKASFTRGELKEATTHSTNAYCVYSTKVATREAARRLNGTVVLGRHLRVDEVAHPMKIDHRRCIFVGNLGFVDDETEVKASLAESDHPEDQKKAKSKPLKGDAEEGLWVQFAKAGTIESVRVVRDPQTRIGKGFAYVQFKDENAVERALLCDGKKFPPLLPRKLRVARCKKPSQTALALDRNKQREREMAKQGARDGRDFKRQMKYPATGANADASATQGRLKKMLGRAGVAKIRTAAKSRSRPPRVNSVLKPEPKVFEGQRATAAQGIAGLRLGGARRKKTSKGQVGKRNDRSKKRAAAYKTKQRDQ